MMNMMLAAPHPLVSPRSKPEPPILRQPRLVSTADFSAICLDRRERRSSSITSSSSSTSTGVCCQHTNVDSTGLVHIQHHAPLPDPTPLVGHLVVEDESEDSHNFFDDDELLDYPDEELLDFSSPPPTNQLDPLPDVQFHNHGKGREDEGILCKAVGQWRPFIDKVAKFVEREHFPFEYVDVWVLDNHKNSEDGSSKDQALKHVGHFTNHRTELCSILTMYHMTQFGSNSEKYVFPPGIGLPGRALARGEPVWDDKLPFTQSFKDFPRTMLARKHGVRKGLGVPLVLPGTSKQAIIVMYTTNDRIHLNDNRRLVDVMYQEFQRRSPFPALAQDSPNHKDDIDMDVDDDDEDQASYHAILPCSTDVQMATILRDYGTSDSVGLQCLLWRAPCRRTLQDNRRLDILKQKFQSEHDDQDDAMSKDEDYREVANMLVKTWEELLGGNSSEEVLFAEI